MANTVSNFSDLIKPGLLALGRERLGMKPGTVVQVSENPMFMGYDVTYKHRNYTKSIQISKEALEDNMAYSYGQEELTDALREQTKMMKQDMKERNQQAQMQQHNHSSGIGAQAFGSIGGLASATSSGTSWDSVTTTNATDTLMVNTDGGLQLDQAWVDEAVERSIAGNGAKKKKPKNRLTKWFRLNEEMPKLFGNDGEYEPLDDLRQEMAAWLEDV